MTDKVEKINSLDKLLELGVIDELDFHFAKTLSARGGRSA